MSLSEVPTFYCLWSAFSIGSSLLLAGPSRESLTRVLVLAFLFVQLLARPLVPHFLPRSSPRTRFIALGTILAAFVEGFHIFSKPVFPSLLVTRNTSLMGGISNYSIDLLFTVPAYLVIFFVIWLFIARYHLPLWHYILIFGIAQMLGDGGLLYFLGAPAMLVFLPYPMSSYHAMNVLPFLSVRETLPTGPRLSPHIYFAVPAIVAVYLACGTLIRLIGQRFGFQ